MASSRICHRCSLLSASTKPTPLLRRTYQSAAHPQPSSYTPTESQILSSALSHVPTHGFTISSLRHGARASGYLDASTQLFPRGPVEIAFYHCVTQRLSLSSTVQFPTQATSGHPQHSPSQDAQILARIKTLVKTRLRANQDIRLRWAEAIALMAQPSHIPPSLRELSLLADEILYLAGDVGVDHTWYTKRGAVASVYAAAEVFQTTDASVDGRETERFVEERLDDVYGLGRGLGEFGEWAGFQARAGVNVLRAWGVRI